MSRNGFGNDSLPAQEFLGLVMIPYIDDRELHVILKFAKLTTFRVALLEQPIGQADHVFPVCLGHVRSLSDQPFKTAIESHRVGIDNELLRPLLLQKNENLVVDQRRTATGLDVAGFERCFQQRQRFRIGIYWHTPMKE